MLFLIIFVASFTILVTTIILNFTIEDFYFSEVYAGQFIVVAMLSAAMCPLWSMPKEVDDGTYTVPIVQLKQGEKSEISGGGFLFWSIKGENEMQYVIMEKYSDGRMQREFLDQENTYIVETTNSPCVVYKSYKKVYPKWRCLPNYWDNTTEHYRMNDAIIYVPVGTVIQKIENI